MLSLLAVIVDAKICGRYLVATTTVWSGASYIYTKDAVKILSRDEGVKDVKIKDKN
jgi:hypothetical protein